jgi:hypothetical protein
MNNCKYFNKEIRKFTVTFVRLSFLVTNSKKLVIIAKMMVSTIEKTYIAEKYAKI